MILIRLYTCMQDRARHLLSNPIKSFHEMQLLLGINVDGTLAMDPETGLDDESGSPNCNSQELNDIQDASGRPRVAAIRECHNSPLG